MLLKETTSSTPAQKLNVVIVGGSLAGLIHGVALTRLGHNVEIIERSSTSTPETQGAGLAVAVDLRTFLERYDKTKLPYGVCSPDFRMINAEGKVVKSMGIVQTFSSWEAIYYRLRANFDGLSSDYVPSPPSKEDGEGHAQYSFGKIVTGVHRNAAGSVVLDIKDQDGKIGSREADLVVAADGPSSTIRQLFEPESKRMYAGYCGWRGTLRETAVSSETQEFLGDLVTFCKINRSYIISYAIPGKKGEMEPEKRMRNWVWYQMYAEGSPEHVEAFTDKDGVHHRITVPIGKIQEELWTKQKKLAQQVLDPYNAELVCKTERPFIQALTDVVSPRASFLDGAVLLVGDALATFRPTTGQSTNQAARNAMDMSDMLQGHMTLAEWEIKSLEYAKKTQSIGVERAKGFGLGPDS